MILASSSRLFDNILMQNGENSSSFSGLLQHCRACFCSVKSRFLQLKLSEGGIVNTTSRATTF